MDNTIDNQELLTVDVEQQEEASSVAESNIYNDLREGKIDYFSLPYKEKERVRTEVYNKLSPAEQEAMNEGWSPKEMFRGKHVDGSPKEWVDAETFLDKIRNNAPVRNERLRNIAKEKQELSSENSELKETIKKLVELQKAKAQRDLAKEESEIDREMQEAEEYSDVSKFKVATQKKFEIEREKLRLKSFDEPPSPPIPVAPEPVKGLSPEVAEFAARNPLIVSDPEMLNYAKAMNAAYDITHAHLPLTERLKLVEEATKTSFASRLGLEKRPLVETQKNSSSFGSKSKTKTFNDLPEAEKPVALRLIKMGHFKDEADFIKTYSWDK